MNREGRQEDVRCDGDTNYYEVDVFVQKEDTIGIRG